jgi:hypothetical protein
MADKNKFPGTPYTDTPVNLRKKKICHTCLNEFVPRCGQQKFCSDYCRNSWKYLIGVVTNETQYKSISGNWNRYFDRLLGRKERRGLLTRQDLLRILEDQKGLCALSGLKLTCQLEVGKKFHTNVSVDRIEAGGTYKPHNVQLVCAALNGFRRETPLKEFIWFCEQVANHQRKEVTCGN